MAAPLDPSAPFALLWDKSLGAARLFTQPRGRIETEDVAAGLDVLRAAARAGDWLAGALSYEAGHALEPRLAPLAKGPPWIRFLRFGPPALLDETALKVLLQPFRRPVSLGAPAPLVSRAEWLSAVAAAKALIAAGDIYQANLTFPVRVPVRGHPLALFARLFTSVAAPHGGVVHDGRGQWWVSLSPELFFALDKGSLAARPMKGTAPRLADPGADRDAASALGQDPKNRAENLMITDLIRNDLARVAVPGSVRVPRLFEIETYPSVHQMTSTVTAMLAPGADAVAALGRLHPCGSITGAPKVRAMEVIAALEPQARGLYCGSLGWIGPDAQSARFSVAIRTLVIEGGEARLGLGSGIVADSEPEAEWAECLAKARFLQPAAPQTLLETMRLEPDGVARLGRHLDRLQASAARFAFRFDRDAVEARLAALSTDKTRRLRLLLGADGALALHLSPLPETPAGPVKVALAPLPVAPTDWRLAHKCGDRAFYDEARRRAFCFEVVFQRADGLLTEGSFTNLFVERDGRLLTPPARLGLLPGVLRAELLATGRAEEAELCAADLAGGFLLGNALRGLIPARLA
jgi:para-aminobenzoate synthetase/4-amino-4-deoxychorismate lyase